MEEEDNYPFNDSTSNSNNDNNTTDITNINIEPSKAGVATIDNQYEGNWLSDGNSYFKGGIYNDGDNKSFDKNGIYNDKEWWGNKDSNYDDNNHSNYEKERNGFESNSDDNTSKVTSPHKVPVNNDQKDIYLSDDYIHSNSLDNNGIDDSTIINDGNSNPEIDCFHDIFVSPAHATDDNYSFNTTPERENAGVWIMKGVGDIHDKKNIALPPHRFRTLTSNAYIALAKNDNTNDNDDNNLYTPVSVRKQKEDDNSFDNYITSKIGVDNRDALAKKVNNINNNNNSINTIDRSKEGVGTIDIVETPGTGNNSSNTIEPSKIGVGKKESNHNNTVIVDSKTKDDYIVSDPDSVSPCLDHIVVSDSVSRSDTRTSINDTSSNNLIHNTNLDLEKGSLP